MRITSMLVVSLSKYNKKAYANDLCLVTFVRTFVITTFVVIKINQLRSLNLEKTESRNHSRDLSSDFCQKGLSLGGQLTFF